MALVYVILTVDLIVRVAYFEVVISVRGYCVQLSICYFIKMAKKCEGRDGFERMNFLFQASNLLQTDQETLCRISDHCSNLLVNVSKRTVLRMDRGIKRSMCKRCRNLLLPGFTCKVRLLKKQIIWRCLKCHKIKRFNSISWTQNDASGVISSVIADDKIQVLQR